MNPAWLHIVGIGEDGLDGLAALSRTLIANADILVGGERHLAMLAEDGRERLSWSRPLHAWLDKIEQRRGQNICVLASGDPMCYGIGVTLSKRFSNDEMQIVPAPSAFSLACARLGWPLIETECLTLHGRPLESLHAFLQPSAKLLLLSHDRNTPQQVCSLLQAQGFGSSKIWVLQHMAGVKERIDSFIAKQIPEQSFADLNTIAIELSADQDSTWSSRVPGLPDILFRHDGQLTKRDVRAMTLAKLKPASRQTLWDVGAGAGSIAIEWMRAARHGHAFAIEANPERAALISSNALALGTPTLTLIEGRAPEALHDLPQPDAIFIGGGINNENMFDTCWHALTSGGRLVANAVTVDSELILFNCYKRFGGELSRCALAQAAPLGHQIAWRAAAPVTQYVVSKP